MNEQEQEISWLKEDIADDEAVMESSNATAFHIQRLEYNKARLQELLLDESLD